MKKIYLMLASALLGTGSLMAQKTWNTQQYGTMQTDTIYHVSIGPGTTETRAKLHFSTTGKTGAEFNASTNINVVEIDLTNPYVTMKVVRAGNTANDVKKDIKEMMAENTTYQKHYFAGVNGDFFGYRSCNYTIADGVMYDNSNMGLNGLKGAPNVPGNSLVIGNDGTPTIATSIQAGVSAADGRFGTINYPSGVVENELRTNVSRMSDYIVLYDRNFTGVIGTGADAFSEPGFTGTNKWGLEAEVLPGESLYGGGECTVGRISVSGNMGIPENGYVLSAIGTKRNDNGKMNTLKTGDKVKINLPFTADGKEISCRETVGGYPRIVVDGQAIAASPTNAPDPALLSRRARTAVGYNADKTKMYIFVVEEGAGKNEGMTVKALGSLMQAMGCHEALNLDGGGSSLLYVENLGNRNSVEGVWNGYTRKVINGLFAVSTAPEDAQVARIEFVDKHLTIKPGRGYQPVIYAYNKYGALISKELQNYTLSAAEATFDATARKMIAPAEGKFALTADYNGIKATIPVYVEADGIDGVEPDAAPIFKGSEFVAMIPDPNEEEEEVAAVLEDVTPDGYNFDKYPLKTKFPFIELPTAAAEGSQSPDYLPPVGVYSQEQMDAAEQITSIRIRGIQHADQYSTEKPDGVKYADQLQRMRDAFTIQNHPNEYVGKCLVFSHQFGVGGMNFGWDRDMTASNMQLTFFADGSKIKGETAETPVRVRLVFQVLHRGRHAQNETQISSIVGSVIDDKVAKPISHNGVSDMFVGAQYPIDGQQFYRWENEGTTIAEMPEEKVLMDGNGQPEFWDDNIATNPYLINGERFMVYEFDAYGKPENGTIAVNVNISDSPHNTYVFKEVKFFNVLNGEELIGKTGVSKAPSRVGNVEKPFATKTVNGSLLGKRSISYRYYTANGIYEFAAETNTGVDNVEVDNNENAQAEYYNLQGIRVENPTNGIYIKRQGSKATKVLVR